MQSGERLTPWMRVFGMSQEGRAALCLPKGTAQCDGLTQFPWKPPGSVLITLFLLFLVPPLRKGTRWC